MNLSEDIKKIIDGDIIEDPTLKAKYKRDTSIFEIEPEVVVSPKSAEDIENLVEFVTKNKKKYPELSLTARSAGTDMSGGTLTDNILLEFMTHFNRVKEMGKDFAVVEPGVYYRDFEKMTDEKGLLFPSYPASKDLCAMGGIVNNNSGGEKTLKYGKTNKYIQEYKIVLADGKLHTIRKLSGAALKKKLAQKDFEGKLYNKIYTILSKNYEKIQASRPVVTKNSAGYNIWDAWDGENLDLTQLICGAQGTLGIVTEATIGLIPKPKKEKLYVIFMKSYDNLPSYLQEILALKPTSLEITDDHTFKIYMRFAREMAQLLGAGGIFSTIKLFTPETLLILRHGMPKLILLVEFEGDDLKELNQNVKAVKEIVKKYKLIGHSVKNKLEANKYWKLRRETFKLFREKIKDRHSTPFVDDIIVKPELFPEFLPKITQLMDDSGVFYTISGHLGDGNLHIIPLLDLKKEDERNKMYPLADKVYKLVKEYNGSITAEHNDGLMRGPYLEEAFGKEIYSIFKEVKEAFDPLNIFNPHKKVDATREYSKKHIITS